MTAAAQGPMVESRRLPVPERSWPWWGVGLANLGVCLVLALLSWWLLVDPKWGLFDVYPQPYTALLFWAVLATVWVGFTFQWLGPASLPQPLRGLVGIGLTVAIAVAITLLLAYGFSNFDPSYAAGREGGAGYTIGNLFVLFGFFFYVWSAVNAGHWPWSIGARQPWTGLGELTLVFIPTVVLYLIFIVPNLATWAEPGGAPMSLPTVIGWFYSIVVAAVITGLAAENRPWSLIKSPAGAAVTSLIGNFVIGTVLYFVLREVATILMGSDNAAALGPAIGSFAAEIGVCWAFWMITWANAFSNKPTNFSTGTNIAIRLLVTLTLGCATFLGYYFFIAEHVLHEPVVVGSMHGDALGFIDWTVLWVLWYVLFLGSWKLPKARVSQETGV